MRRRARPRPPLRRKVAVAFVQQGRAGGGAVNLRPVRAELAVSVLAAEPAGAGRVLKGGQENSASEQELPYPCVHRARCHDDPSWSRTEECIRSCSAFFDAAGNAPAP